MFIRELAGVLEDLGIATYGVDLFIGTSAAVPRGAGPFYLLKDTGGLAPVGVHNHPTTPGYERPGVQVTAIAAAMIDAETAAKTIFNAFYAIRNQYIGTVWYLSVLPTQEPFPLPTNDVYRRNVYAFNATGLKLPSVGSTFVNFYVIGDFGGDPTAFYQSAVADVYPAGTTFASLVPGSSSFVLSAVPSGSVVLEASAKVAAAGARVKVALYRLDTDVVVAGSELVFTTGQVDGEVKRSSALTLIPGTTYGIKETVDSALIGAAVWNAHLLHL